MNLPEMMIDADTYSALMHPAVSDPAWGRLESGYGILRGLSKDSFTALGRRALGLVIPGAEQSMRVSLLNGYVPSVQ